jgi:hypothetical protein
MGNKYYWLEGTEQCMLYNKVQLTYVRIIV